MSSEYSANLSAEISGKNGNGADYGPRAKQFERLKDETETKIATLKQTPEYKKAEQLMLEKYHPVLGELFSDLSLT